MARKSETKRAAALKLDPLAYRREVSGKVADVSAAEGIPCEVKFVLVGRLMLSDRSGEISKLGVFEILAEQAVIAFERVEWNGFSIPVYLTRTPENVQSANAVVQYGDVIMIEGAKLSISGVDVFLGESVLLLSKAVGDVYDSNIDFRKRANLYAHRHLQLIRNPDKTLHFRRCSAVFRVIRQFLYREGYEELSITLLQESFEAGLADPFVTYATEHNRDMYLRVTSELFLRKLMIAGLNGVFEISKSFRNQGSTSVTLPQFTILELYRAFAGQEEMERLLRDMIRSILVELYGSEIIMTDTGVIDCSGKWPVYDFRDEVLKITGSKYDERYTADELSHLLEEGKIPLPKALNKYTIATALYSHVVSRIRGPAFLRNLPAAQSPLFKVNDDGSTVDETLLVINGMLVADIVNPERDPVVMRQNLHMQLQYRKGEMDRSVNEDILHAMRFGLPPCRGIGMGLERLLMLLLNISDIREVDLFPVF